MTFLERLEISDHLGPFNRGWEKDDKYLNNVAEIVDVSRNWEGLE